MIELRLKLGQLQRGGLQSSRFQLTTPREGFSLERLFASRGFLPREAFCLERVFASRGFLPGEVFCLERVFASRGFLPREDSGRERILAKQIQNLTCRFLVVNQVHCKGPSMVLDRERKLVQATGRD